MKRIITKQQLDAGYIQLLPSGLIETHAYAGAKLVGEEIYEVDEPEEPIDPFGERPVSQSDSPR